MSPLEETLSLSRFALAAIEQSRQRIDDLNVYPVPDGDTGTNLTLTARAVVEQLEGSAAADRSAVAHELTRAALMGARGNSGVIFSQIVRGAAEVLGDGEPADVVTCKRALRGASDAAYRAVRRPVEGTMLTVIREMAEEAESSSAATVSELMHAVVRRGEDALARTPELLAVLRDAGVVDAGGAGLLEIVRGITAGLAGEPLPAALPREELGFEAVHQEPRATATAPFSSSKASSSTPTRSRPSSSSSATRCSSSATAARSRCTSTPTSPAPRSRSAPRPGRSRRSRSPTCTSRPPSARSGSLRCRRRPRSPTSSPSSRARVTGGSSSRLGATSIIDGGQTMNPATADLHEAIDAARAPEVIVLPNNGNVILSAEQAASLSTKPVYVIHADSIPAGLAAMVAYDPNATGEENAELMREAVESVATGEVTVASRDAELNGFHVSKGHYLGLAGGSPVAEGESFDDVAGEVVERLLAEPRGVLTLLTGSEPQPLERLLARVAELHPEVELDVQRAGSRTIRCCSRPSERRAPPVRVVLVEDNAGLPRGARAPARPARRRRGGRLGRRRRRGGPGSGRAPPRRGADRLPAARASTAWRQRGRYALASPEIAVVCLTASASPRERDALLEAGAVVCLSKDEELDEIVAAIHRAADSVAA